MSPSAAITATISIVGLLIFLGRFLYVPILALDIDVKYPPEDKLFGFTWLSTFLSRIGNEFSWFACGLFLHFLCNFLREDVPIIRKYLKYFANLIIATALYFMSWALYDGNNFSMYTEIAFSIATAIMAAYIINRFMRPTLDFIQQLLRKIRGLVDVIILKAPKHVKNEEVWDKEIVEPTLDKLNE